MHQENSFLDVSLSIGTQNEYNEMTSSYEAPIKPLGEDHEAALLFPEKEEDALLYSDLTLGEHRHEGEELETEYTTEETLISSELASVAKQESQERESTFEGSYQVLSHLGEEDILSSYALHEKAGLEEAELSYAYEEKASWDEITSSYEKKRKEGSLEAETSYEIEKLSSSSDLLLDGYFQEVSARSHLSSTASQSRQEKLKDLEGAYDMSHRLGSEEIYAQYGASEKYASAEKESEYTPYEKASLDEMLFSFEGREKEEASETDVSYAIEGHASSSELQGSIAEIDIDKVNYDGLFIDVAIDEKISHEDMDSFYERETYKDSDSLEPSLASILSKTMDTSTEASIGLKEKNQDAILEGEYEVIGRSSDKKLVSEYELRNKEESFELLSQITYEEKEEEASVDSLWIAEAKVGHEDEEVSVTILSMDRSDHMESSYEYFEKAESQEMSAESKILAVEDYKDLSVEKTSLEKPKSDEVSSSYDFIGKSGQSDYEFTYAFYEKIGSKELETSYEYGKSEGHEDLTLSLEVKEKAGSQEAAVKWYPQGHDKASESEAAYTFHEKESSDSLDFFFDGNIKESYDECEALWLQENKSSLSEADIEISIPEKEKFQELFSSYVISIGEAHSEVELDYTLSEKESESTILFDTRIKVKAGSEESLAEIYVGEKEKHESLELEYDVSSKEAKSSMYFGYSIKEKEEASEVEANIFLNKEISSNEEITVSYEPRVKKGSSEGEEAAYSISQKESFLEIYSEDILIKEKEKKSVLHGYPIISAKGLSEELEASLAIKSAEFSEIQTGYHIALTEAYIEAEESTVDILTKERQEALDGSALTKEKESYEDLIADYEANFYKGHLEGIESEVYVHINSGYSETPEAEVEIAGAKEGHSWAHIWSHLRAKPVISTRVEGRARLAYKPSLSSLEASPEIGAKERYDDLETSFQYNRYYEETDIKDLVVHCDIQDYTGATEIESDVYVHFEIGSDELDAIGRTDIKTPVSELPTGEIKMPEKDLATELLVEEFEIPEKALYSEEVEGDLEILTKESSSEGPDGDTEIRIKYRYSDDVYNDDVEVKNSRNSETDDAQVEIKTKHASSEYGTEDFLIKFTSGQDIELNTELPKKITSKTLGFNIDGIKFKFWNDLGPLLVSLGKKRLGADLESTLIPRQRVQGTAPFECEAQILEKERHSLSEASDIYVKFDLWSNIDTEASLAESSRFSDFSVEIEELRGYRETFIPVMSRITEVKKYDDLEATARPIIQGDSNLEVILRLNYVNYLYGKYNAVYDDTLDELNSTYTAFRKRGHGEVEAEAHIKAHRDSVMAVSGTMGKKAQSEDLVFTYNIRGIDDLNASLSIAKTPMEEELNTELTIFGKGYEELHGESYISYEARENDLPVDIGHIRGRDIRDLETMAIIPLQEGEKDLIANYRLTNLDYSSDLPVSIALNPANRMIGYTLKVNTPYRTVRTLITKDASVAQKKPIMNYGKAVQMAVGFGDDGISEGYFAFKIKEIEHIVNYDKVNLVYNFIRPTIRNMVLKLKEVSNNWGESYLRYDNRPSHGETIKEIVLPAGSTRVVFDMKDYVENWKIQDPMPEEKSFVVVAEGAEEYIGFLSRESVNPPHIEAGYFAEADPFGTNAIDAEYKTARNEKISDLVATFHRPRFSGELDLDVNIEHIFAPFQYRDLTVINPLRKKPKAEDLEVDVKFVITASSEIEGTPHIGETEMIEDFLIEFPDQRKWNDPVFVYVDGERIPYKNYINKERFQGRTQEEIEEILQGEIESGKLKTEMHYIYIGDEKYDFDKYMKENAPEDEEELAAFLEELERLGAIVLQDNPREFLAKYEIPIKEDHSITEEASVKFTKKHLYSEILGGASLVKTDLESELECDINIDITWKHDDLDCEVGFFKKEDASLIDGVTNWSEDPLDVDLEFPEKTGWLEVESSVVVQVRKHSEYDVHMEDQSKPRYSEMDMTVEELKFTTGSNLSANYRTTRNWHSSEMEMVVRELKFQAENTAVPSTVRMEEHGGRSELDAVAYMKVWDKSEISGEGKIEKTFTGDEFLVNLWTLGHSEEDAELEFYRKDTENDLDVTPIMDKKEKTNDSGFEVTAIVKVHLASEFEVGGGIDENPEDFVYIL